MHEYIETFTWEEGDFVYYGDLTDWPSACYWIVPGTYRDVD